MAADEQEPAARRAGEKMPARTGGRPSDRAPRAGSAATRRPPAARALPIPDLEIAIRLQYQEHKWALRYELTAADPDLDLYHRHFLSGQVRKDPHAYFAGLFRDIETLRVDTARDREIAAKKLASKGSNLLRQLIPRELQRRLWDLRETVRTVLVLADEETASVPWELIRLRSPQRDSADGMFLCEMFDVARWLPEVGKVPVLTLAQPALVVPASSRLAGAPLERKALRQLFAEHGRKAADLSAEYGALLDALATGQYDCLHFTGHGLSRGDDPDTWLIGLDGKEPLRAEDITEAHRFGARKPLVVLNACHSGRSALALTTLGGWSSQCIAAGAGAFLGCHWAVPDDKAREFALDFYRRLLAGAPIGQAVRESRLELRSRHPGDPTWLAYTLYADPTAAVGVATAPGPKRPGNDVRSAPPSSPPVTGATAEEPRPRMPRGRRRGGSRETAVPEQGDQPVTSPTPAPPGPQPGEERVHELDGTTLVFVPGGEYTVGDDDGHDWSRPAHRVILSGFWIGRAPVTNRQYARFLAETPQQPPPAFWEEPGFDQPEQPVVGVSWHEAVAYCRWAGLALPGEAQWEAAARGADRRRYPWGDEPPDPRRANFGSRVGAPSAAGDHDAGRGPFGTLDQAGNVWEWCADAWDLTAYRGREDRELDPVGRGDPAIRAVRGGSWASPADALEAPFRSRAAAKQRLKDQGFRCLWLPR